MPHSVRAQRGWQRLGRWLLWCGFAGVIPMLVLNHRAVDLGRLDLGPGRGAGLDALFWAVPRLALDPPPGTAAEAVQAAWWYLIAAGCVSALFVASGIAWLQAQIPTPAEYEKRPRRGA